MSVQNFSFLARLEVAEKFVVVRWGGGGGGGPDQFEGSALVKLNNMSYRKVSETQHLGHLSILHSFHSFIHPFWTCVCS